MTEDLVGVRCRLYGPDDPETAAMRARVEAEARELCRRCEHPYSDHPWPQATACQRDGCTCHCFWHTVPGVT